VTFEARLAFIAFFVLCWCVLGLIPWAVAAVWVRGRGALVALPLALASACSAGILVPLLGQRDAKGYFLSLATALVVGALGSAAGIAFARRLSAATPAPERPAVAHSIGAPRPATIPSPPAESPEPSEPRATNH
jgi:hypothetical protein